MRTPAVLFGFSLLCASSVAAQVQVPPGAMAIEASTLDEVDSSLKATATAIGRTSVEDLGLTYKDGKHIEAMRQIVLRRATLGQQWVANTRRSPSIESTVALAHALAELRIALRDYSSVLDDAGFTSGSPDAVRAAIPLVELVTTLDTIGSQVDERVQKMTVLADEALRKCSKRTGG